MSNAKVSRFRWLFVTAGIIGIVACVIAGVFQFKDVDMTGPQSAAHSRDSSPPPSKERVPPKTPDDVPSATGPFETEVLQILGKELGRFMSIECRFSVKGFKSTKDRERGAAPDWRADGRVVVAGPDYIAVRCTTPDDRTQTSAERELVLSSVGVGVNGWAWDGRLASTTRYVDGRVIRDSQNHGDLSNDVLSTVPLIAVLWSQPAALAELLLCTAQWNPDDVAIELSNAHRSPETIVTAIVKLDRRTFMPNEIVFASPTNTSITCFEFESPATNSVRFRKKSNVVEELYSPIRQVVLY